MAIPELDLKKVNLQAAVGYLISLHDNEVDWNLLGIKVIGQVETAEDIPAGDYEYGDAYEVGTEPPYDLYIYTRPDGEVHTEGYWFPVGKFPMPGPQGPKGDGVETLTSISTGTPSDVGYDNIYGITMTSDATINYKDSTTGALKSQTATLDSEIPILPGKYISMDATLSNDAIEVKVDDTALALDYYKINKEKKYSVPTWDGTKSSTINCRTTPDSSSLAWRDTNGDCSFRYVKIDGISNTGSSKVITYWDIWRNIYDEALTIAKTTTDTGTLTVSDLGQLQAPGYYMVKYDNQLYYRYDPREAPNGTLNYIHLDSIEDGNGGYKATGKCFSVTVSTRAWKVVDLDFGGSTPASQATEIYRHGITMNDANIVVKLDIYDSNSQNYTYEQLKAKLSSPSYCANARIKRSDGTYYYSPATIAYWNDSTGDFALTYNNTEGNSVNVNWTPSVVSDNGTQIL